MSIITEVYTVLTLVLLSLHSVWQEQNQIHRLREAESPYHPISLKQTVVKPEDMTEILPQRDDLIMSYASKKQHVLFQTYLGEIIKENRKVIRHS